MALKSAERGHGVTADDIEAFILVGGSSKNPLVAKLLRDRYRKPVKDDLNPDEIVAIGAARMALNYDPSLAAEVTDGAELQIDTSASVPSELTSTNIKDVVSHTLGVGLKDDVYDPLIPKDHIIPHKVIRGGYTTAEDNQTSIFVPVFQGDNTRASLNTKLGSVMIPGLTPEPKGHHQFQITFALNADGIFEGEILHVGTGQRKEIKLDRGDLGLTEKKRMALAEMVDSGALGAAPSGAAPAASGHDPVQELVGQAHEILKGLPAGSQRELLEGLQKLETARAGGDSNDVAAAVASLTMLIMRHRH